MKFPTLGGITAQHPAASGLIASTSLPALPGRLSCWATPTPVASSWTRSGESRVRSFGVGQARLVTRQPEFHHRDGDRRHHNRRRALGT